MDGGCFQRSSNRESKNKKSFILAGDFSFKALAIDEKIGYPEYVASSNTSELERMYREVSEDVN